jgi:hypothetical protein
MPGLLLVSHYRGPGSIPGKSMWDCGGQNGNGIGFSPSTGVPPYPRVIRSKTYRGYVKPHIIPNTIYNMIYV